MKKNISPATIIFPLITFLILFSGCSTESETGFTLITESIPEDGGTVSPPSGTYEQGSSVEITAEPAEGYLFERWEGDITGQENPANITFHGDLHVTAVFEAALLVSGDGSLGNPYEVSTVHQLQAINDPEYLDKHFIQIADIDASPSAEFQNDTGFRAIGNKETPFTGTYDGNGYKITDLTIHRPRSADFDIGLFGYVKEGLIKNVTIENDYETWKNGRQTAALDATGYEWTETLYTVDDLHEMNGNAGLVGFNDGGTITNSRFIGRLRGHINHEVGGLAGINTGRIEDSEFTGTISSGRSVSGLVHMNAGTVVSSSVDASLVGMRAFGLVHTNYGELEKTRAHVNLYGSMGASGMAYRNEGGRIDQSYATGILRGNRQTAGFVVTNDGEITNSYSVADIEADDLDYDLFHTAGFATENRPDGTINHSFYAGTITLSDESGASAGFVLQNEGSLSSSFWDTETTGHSEAVADGNPEGATGLTTQQITGPAAQTNMPEFDWQTVWRTADGYPVLRWQENE